MSILVQREFAVAPADRPEFERQSREGLWPAFLHFGAPMVAYGTWAFGGPSDVVVTHTTYADLAHWAATRQGVGAYYQDAAMRAEIEPYLKVYGNRGEVIGSSIASLFEMDDAVSRARPVARQAGQPVPEAPPTFGRGSVISERTISVPPANLAEFRRLSAEVIWPWLESHGGRVLGMGHNLMGPSDEVTTWFAFRSLGEWYRQQHPSQMGAPAAVVGAFTSRASFVRQKSGRILMIGSDFGVKV
ncbi:MAG: hypothetical protein EPO65_09430 [Dehalococcoidia bacterium]|nr:MAG: hypothetical protein EPO65_09430 [Dehalococcoidia bacterium]